MEPAECPDLASVADVVPKNKNTPEFRTAQKFILELNIVVDVHHTKGGSDVALSSTIKGTFDYIHIVRDVKNNLQTRDKYGALLETDLLNQAFKAYRYYCSMHLRLFSNT
jgi:hypothetical protein